MINDPVAAGFTDQGSLTPDNLLAGDYPRATKMVTITGAALAKGTVLGRITASDKYNKSLSAAGDGSQVPKAILAADTDASGGDVLGPVYFTGEFNEDALVLGTAHSLASIRDGLRQIGIFLKKIVPA
ncbi:head decoration protein [Reyranella sp.]|uniref:head decoration protein n=1 Tax=Reyranella sp. TaxID=1929291 RepID=UPI003C7C1A8C